MTGLKPMVVRNESLVVVGGTWERYLGRGRWVAVSRLLPK